MSWKMALTVPFHKLIFWDKNGLICAIFQPSEEMTWHPNILHTPRPWNTAVTVSFHWSYISFQRYKIWRVFVKLSRQDLFHQVNLAFVRPTSLWWSISHKLQRLAGRQGYQLVGHHTHIHLLGGHWGGPHPLCQSGGQALYLVIFG